MTLPIGLSQNYIFIHKDSYSLPHRKHDSFLLKETSIPSKMAQRIHTKVI